MIRPNGPPSWREKFVAAGAGIAAVWRTESSGRVHGGIALLVVVLAMGMRVTLVDGALLALAIGLVWVTEMINTAIETVVDLAQPEMHPLAKRAKDIAAGAVLVAAGTAIVVGGLVFGPALLQL
ncbi:MAG: diacylglycerol kinase family protein [Planctomycetota bacterium]|nr:MAG: diacylglycerol kinase family protein [Planctomycetota bacterium]